MAKATKSVKSVGLVRSISQAGSFVGFECAACRNGRHYNCIQRFGGNCDCNICEKIRAEVMIDRCTPVDDKDKETE